MFVQVNPSLEWIFVMSIPGFFGYGLIESRRIYTVSTIKTSLAYSILSNHFFFFKQHLPLLPTFEAALKVS